MPDGQRLEKAWKLHQRAQVDVNHEAINAAVLRDKILVEERVSLEQLEARFSETVSPAGGGRAWAGPAGSGFGQVDPDLWEKMEQFRARGRESTQEQQSQARFNRQRSRYGLSQEVQDVIEDIIQAYRSEHIDLALVKTLTDAMQGMTQCQTQLSALAEKINQGELASDNAQQQAFRTMARVSAQQVDTIQSLLALVLVFAGGGVVQRAAASFDESFGRKP